MSLQKRTNERQVLMYRAIRLHIYVTEDHLTMGRRIRRSTLHRCSSPSRQSCRGSSRPHRTICRKWPPPRMGLWLRLRTGGPQSSSCSSLGHKDKLGQESGQSWRDLINNKKHKWQHDENDENRTRTTQRNVTLSTLTLLIGPAQHFFSTMIGSHSKKPTRENLKM